MLVNSCTYLPKTDLKDLCLGCESLFTDNTKKHMLAYKKEGIAPQADISSLRKLYTREKLIHLGSSNYYKIKNLDHSYPYVLPKTESFLHALSNSYANKCANKNLNYVPFNISSLTRTKESVKALMKINGNSIENSSHLKGKTFDISYADFCYNPTQLTLFIESLQELRKQGKCYVKFERNGCLHITAR
jgi:hypothetical protein